MSRRRGLLPVLGAVPVALAIVVLAPAVELAGALMGVFCFGAAFWLGFRRGRRDLFSPPVLVLAYMGLGIAVKGLVSLASHESKIAGALDPTGGEAREVMMKVFLVGLLGAAAFLAGDRLAGLGRSRRRPLRPTAPLPSRRINGALAVGSGLTLFAGAVLVSRLGIDVILRPAFVSVEGTFGLFWLYPLLFGGIYAWTLAVANDWVAGRGATPVHISGLVLTALVVYMLTSSKAALLTSVTLLLVVRHYAVRPLPTSRLVGIGLLFLIALPLLYMHRAYGLDAAALDLVTPEVLLSGFAVLLGRSYLADSLAAIIHYTPDVYGYAMGRPWLELFYFWVPRGLWPDKPVSAGLSFGETYLSSYTEAGSSFFTITMVGDGYMNFGVVGVVLLMGALGWLFGRFYRGMVGGRPTVGRLVIYAAAVYPLAISPEQSLSVFWGLVMSYLAVALFVVGVAVQGPFRRRSP